jgi:hypothetical protein
MAARAAHRRFGDPEPAPAATKRATPKVDPSPSPAGGPRARGKPRSPEEQQAERTRQALLGMLVGGSSADGGRSLAVDEARLNERLNAMAPAEIERVAEFLSQIRVVEEPSEKPLIDRVEDQLAQRGIRLEMKGQTNNVYIAGDNPTWHVEKAPESLDGQKASGTYQRDNRAPYRNSWGQQLGRQVKNFINGH